MPTGPEPGRARDRRARFQRTPSDAIPTPKDFARRLPAQEAAARPAADANEPPAFSVCEKLRDPLAGLMGGGGFRSRLSRALVLAGAEALALRALHVKEDGSLGGLDQLAAKLDAPALAGVEVALVTFIGTALTMR